MQAQVKALKECEVDQRELAVLRQQETLKDQRIANLEKELELAQRETELKDKIISIKDMEIAAQQRAFSDMKEVTDRALKLAETKKSNTSSIWYILGAFAGGLIMGLALCL